jgi:hypothetical protein
MSEISRHIHPVFIVQVTHCVIIRRIQLVSQRSGVCTMTAIRASIERHHKPIIAVLGAVIVLLAVSCLFHDIVPICHYVFGCDHGMHVAAAP